MDSPEEIELYVERITEPYTGQALIGVGGYSPASNGLARVEVRYDGDTAAVLIPVLTGLNRLHFSTQLPIETELRRVQVACIYDKHETVVFDETLDKIRDRTQPADVSDNGLLTKFSGLVRRGFRSFLTGEIFSLWRWKARLDRLSDFILRCRQKVRYKLLARRFRPRLLHAAYVANTTLSRERLIQLQRETQVFRYRPKISILLPVYNVEPHWFLEAVQSVRDQVYNNWELCIADDASTNPALIKAFDKLPQDPRIKLTRREINGHISAASNTAADLATGEYIALLDHDDTLASTALYEIVRMLQHHPDADVIYSDEDKITEDGSRYDPQFKPDWSPELLLSYNYVNHFTCIRRAVFEKAGRFRIGFEGSQDHDLLLRVTELTDRVYHIPAILYHWRSLASSTANAAGVKNYVHTSGQRAVAESLERRGVALGLSTPVFAKQLGLPILQLDGMNCGPSVAIIIYGAVDIAIQTLQAITRTTKYRRFTKYLHLGPHASAEGLNRIAKSCTEDIVVFFSAGLVPRDADWLGRLVAYLSLPNIGAVGGLIRAKDGTIHSAGTVLGLKDGVGPGNSCLGVQPGEVSYYFYAEVARNVSAPGAGVLATRRTVFDRVGGFDANQFPNTLFDVDYGLRLRQLGLRCVHVGGAEFAHSGSPSDRVDDPRELVAFRKIYGRPVDPYYNPNFSNHYSFRPLNDSAVSLHPGTPVRTLIATHNLNNPEGAPRYLSEIVLGLHRRGAILPAVWSPLGGAGEGVYWSEDIPVTIAKAEWSRRFVDGQWSPREYEAAQNTLLSVLRKDCPAVVVANTLLTFPIVEAAARLGIPAVWIIHESYSVDHLARLYTPFARWRLEAAFALAARIIPASHDTAKLFAHLDVSSNIHVLHNGLASAPFDAYMKEMSRLQAMRAMPGPRGKKRILSVGTVCERKGQHTLIEAAAKLAKSRDDFVCLLVGARDTVPYVGYVRELIRRRGLNDIVHLISETDDVWTYYRAADVFVCTSHMETFSRAILEAEAFGLPIVTTPCSGVSEQVFWSFNALRFEIGDAKGLATQLEQVLANDHLRDVMGFCSRAAFEAHLDYEEMLDRYEAVIRSTTDSTLRPPYLVQPIDRLNKARQAA
jgi:glycosyltransferase involved in cell wall biosynthesis/GT2 family glycosyltransferase